MKKIISFMFKLREAGERYKNYSIVYKRVRRLLLVS